MHLRRHDHRGFLRKLRMIIPHHDRGRSDLLHRRLGNITLGRLELVAIAATAAAARLRLGRLHYWDIETRRNEGDSFLGLFDHLAPKQDGATDHQGEEDDVRNQRNGRALAFVVVETPDVFDRDWLRSEYKGWKLLRK